MRRVFILFWLKDGVFDGFVFWPVGKWTFAYRKSHFLQVFSIPSNRRKNSVQVRSYLTLELHAQKKSRAQKGLIVDFLHTQVAFCGGEKKWSRFSTQTGNQCLLAFIFWLNRSVVPYIKTLCGNLFLWQKRHLAWKNGGRIEEDGPASKNAKISSSSSISCGFPLGSTFTNYY